MKPYYQIDPSPETIRRYIEQQTCWICGKDGWKALSQHLVKKHGLPAAEVREMAYMFKRERLISDELSEVISKDALRRFGKRRHIPIRGVSSPKGILSRKQKDILKNRIKKIRPLAALSQRKRRRPHSCPVCDKLVLTSKPLHCSSECTHIAWSQAARQAMIPERIAVFKTILYHPTPEEQSRIAKAYWAKIKSLPIEEQKKINLKRAESRRVRVTKICLICRKEFDIIPSQVGKLLTCRSDECKREIYRRKGLGRKHTAEAIAKMSTHAKKRHEIEGGRFGKK